MAKVFRVRRKDGTFYPMWFGRVQVNGRRERRAFSIYKDKAQDMYDDWRSMSTAQGRGGINKDISWEFFKTEHLRFTEVHRKLNTFYATRRGFDVVDSYMHTHKLSHMTPARLLEIQTRILEETKILEKQGKEPRVSKSTLARSLVAVIEAMHRAEKLKYVPMQDWKIIEIKHPKGRLDYYEVDKYEELLKKLEGDWLTSAWLMGRAGLRRGEALYLEWPDVQFSNGRIIFRSKPDYGWQIKGEDEEEKIRIVPLDPGLAAHLRSIARPRGFVLSGECSRRLDTYGKQVTKALKATGVRTFKGKFGFPHILRHTFGSHLAQAGVSESVIMELMGHSSTRMVKIYAHLRPVDMQHGIASLGKLVATFVPLAVTGQAVTHLLTHPDADSTQGHLPSKNGKNGTQLASKSVLLG